MNSANGLNSPIKWVGGKSRLRKFIVPLLPEHTCYVELFAGGAWVLFGKSRSDVEVLNDIDKELINFYRILKYHPEALIESFEWELVSRARFDELAQQSPENLTDIQRAHRFYYMIMAGWGGEFNYPRFQTSITDGGHGNRLIGAIKHLREKLAPVHARLQTVIIECLGWQDCFARYDRANTVMYVDPPYPNNKSNYKHNMRSWEDHQLLAEALRGARCKWILSSYDKPEVYSLYPGYTIIPVQAASGMNKTKEDTSRLPNKEVLIINFIPPQHVMDQIDRLRQSAAIDEDARPEPAPQQSTFIQPE